MKFEFKAVVTFLESSAFLTTIIWLSSDMGFRRKLKKTPEREIERAEKIKREYYEEKKLNNPK